MNNTAHGPSAFDRERERDMEEQHRQRAMQQQEELAQREREHNERQESERQRRDQYQAAPPHQNNAGSIPIHQPVASRLPGAIHSPGGLLANHGGAPPPPGPLGAPSGPSNAFGGPLHAEAGRAIQHNQPNGAAQPPQHQLYGAGMMIQNGAPQNIPNGVPSGPSVGFGGPLQQQEAATRLQQIPFGGPPASGHQIQTAQALGQGGQQPILNDALSYLDQVKVQFADQPDVYNRFLDIMKDFKSQAIDTPGVINRVSELFAGHPNLIQGFNTFLPPGYRIECGAGNDPNTIRVTTPMGTTVQSITGAGRALPDGGAGQGVNGNGTPFYGSRLGNWQQSQQNAESPEALLSPPNQNNMGFYGGAQQQLSSYEAQQAAAAAALQQQQRGVSQLTNAVATLGHPPRNPPTPTPGAQTTPNGANQPGLEKRGPVEFNHAISYVNKIKNRFQDRPEIYKQFLEILQTYQRESKPIQDVYAQVTQLFNTAPDLLEDFKQFLPESAAQAKAAAAKAAEAAEEIIINHAGPASQHQAVHRAEAKMPPVGNFAVPASTSKENKKRPRAGVPVAPAGPPLSTPDSARGVAPGGPVNKRAKLNNGKPATDIPAVSPTLTPLIPEPLAAPSMTAATSEELAFFDRVKKYINNKSTMNEFLKLCNLFSQDLIDAQVLIQKASRFIGGNPDLMTWFRQFVSEGAEEPINNHIDPEKLGDIPGRVSLNNCRGLGPSYRLLPKRERMKPCSGRDELAQSVLNDDWCSHPTWASEDSGFVSHRKNVFEEGLHRIEEERHDYDFNIEVNLKVIQLLEPVAQTILSLDPSERENFRMPGFQSSAIYRRVLKKIYGQAAGSEIATQLFIDPFAVLPVVLARMKEKDQAWRFAQREWDRVWHDQTVKIYLKSLDHMGIQVKTIDKKKLASKYLVDAIKTKREEQRRERTKSGNVPKYQYLYKFEDHEVVGDVLRIMIVYANHATQHNSSEKGRISEFFQKFIRNFFGLPEALVDDRTEDLEPFNMASGSADDDDESTPAELSNGRGRRAVNGKKPDLRRGVLDKGRNGTKGRGHKEDSASGSKESTPDGDVVMEDDSEPTDEQAASEVTNERWTTVPGPAAMSGTRPLDAEDIGLTADQPYQRDYYSLYCNQTIYTIFCIFQTLYSRFKTLKDSEIEALACEERAKMDRPAANIGLLDNHSSYFKRDYSETHYDRALRLVEDFASNKVEETKFSDQLRNVYLKNGWQLYTVNELLKTLCRLGANCSSADPKEKSRDLIEQFYKNRDLKEVSYNTEINLRKQADKYVKDGDLFLIKWFPEQNHATCQWVKKDETTFNLDDMERKERWQYYVSSFSRIEPTEGVPRRLLRKVVLTRNLPSGDSDFEESLNPRKPLVWDEDLTLRICLNTYRIILKENGSEYFIYTDKELGDAGKPASDRLEKATGARSQRFKEKLEMNNKWMKNLSRDEVQKRNDNFQRWVRDGILPGSAPAPAETEMAA